MNLRLHDMKISGGLPDMVNLESEKGMEGKIKLSFLLSLCCFIVWMLIVGGYFPI